MIGKDVFEQWLLEEAEKNNTSILSDSVFDEIIRFLETGVSDNRNIKKRVERQDYRILDFPGVSLKEVLCAKTKSEVMLLFMSISSFECANFIAFDVNVQL